MGECVQFHSPGTLPPEGNPLLIVQEGVWAQSRLHRSSNPRTFQPLASRYIDYLIRAPDFLAEVLLCFP